jgi:hypothetical protein
MVNGITLTPPKNENQRQSSNTNTEPNSTVSKKMEIGNLKTKFKDDKE